MAVTVTTKHKIKRTGADAKKVEAAFHEVHENTPAIVKQTSRKQGAAAGERQRVAIALSKARAAGASIPDKSGSNYVSPNELHTPTNVTGQGTTTWRRGSERVVAQRMPPQETSFKNPSDLHNYPTNDAYRAQRFPALRFGDDQVKGELDDMKLPVVERVMNPVEACRRFNNAARDKRTNLGRGKAGPVVANEEAAPDAVGKR